MLAEAERGDTPATSKKGKRKRTHNIDLDGDEDREDSVVLESHIKREPEDTPAVVKKGKRKSKAAADMEVDEAGEGSTAPKRKKTKRSKKESIATPAADTPDTQPSTTSAPIIPMIVAVGSMDLSIPTPVSANVDETTPSSFTNALTSPQPATSTVGNTSIFDANVPDTDTPIPSIFTASLTSPPTTSARQGYSSIFGGG